MKKLDDSVKRLTELVDVKVLPQVMALAPRGIAGYPGADGDGGAAGRAGPGELGLALGLLLGRLVNLAELSNDLQRATHAILMGAGAPPGAPAAAPAGGGGGSSGGNKKPPNDPPDPFDKDHGADHLGKVGRIYRTARTSLGRAKSYVATGRKYGWGAGASAGRAVGTQGAVNAGAAAGGMAGAVAGGIVAVGVAAYDAGKAIVKWTDEALASASKLAEASGSMAQVMAERENRQFQRDQARGEATADSARALMEAEDRRKNAMAPLENALDNLQNNLLTIGNDIMTPVLEVGGKILEVAKEIPVIGGLLKDKKNKDEQQEIMNGMSAEAARVMGRIAADERMYEKLMEDAERAAAGGRGGVAAPEGAAAPGMGIGGGGRAALPPL